MTLNNRHILSSTNNPDHWYERAEEMRCLAEDVSVEGGKEALLRCAIDYDALGDRAYIRLLKEKNRVKTG